MKQYIIIYLILCAFSTNTLACMVPDPGYGYSAQQLIDNSENIYVVELVQKKSYGTAGLFELRAIEVLKGKKSDPIWSMQLSEYGHHDNSAYFGHWNPLFWLMDTGRSKFPCCVCGPIHTFDVRYHYLYFPELTGARKSAEIIQGDHDLWYRYVQYRIKKGQNEVK